MSAEEEKDVAGETPEKPKAAKKPAAKKAAKKAPAKKAAAEGDTPQGATPEKAKAIRKPRRKAAAKAEPEAEAKAGADEGDTPQGDTPGDAAQAGEKAARAKVAKEPAPKAAPSRRGKGGQQTARRRVVRARARYVRTSARKARMVCGHLRGKSIAEARAILAFTPREVARDWSKLLESAVANAESNHELLQDDLVVREAYADEGPTIKRFRPRAMGRATPIRKRTSHLTITLTAAPEDGAGRRKG
jgi:ribosomal protein L22